MKLQSTDFTPKKRNQSNNKTVDTAPDTTQVDTDRRFVSKVYELIGTTTTDISRRNADIRKRYRYIYEDGLYEETNIKSGFDRTRYNLLRRVLEIHASQVMGRMFQVKSTYDKQDLSVFSLPGGADDETQKKQKDQAIILNGRRSADADTRIKAWKNIIKDNGGWAMWSRAAHLAEWAGFAAFKAWPDKKAGKYHISLIETPENFGAKWADSNFREADLYFYNYQISLSQANRLYADKLDKDANGNVIGRFSVSAPGGPVDQSIEGEDLLRLNQPMVWVTDVTGYVDGFNGKDGKITEADRGKETQVSTLIVGGKLCETITDEALIPKYYIVNTLEVPQQPWGASTISDELMQINGTIMQTVSDWISSSWKTLFAKYAFKGFTALNIPKNLEREVQGYAMDVDQDIHLIQPPTNQGEYEKLLGFLMDQFVKHARVSRVMLDDPSVNSDSDRALMTQMKPMVDITREKQHRWAKLLNDMSTDALNAISGFDDSFKEAVDDAGVWEMNHIWPSVLNREDQAYQQMYINRWNAGTISPESYMEAMGVDDVSEEMDRIRDTMADPVRAAMMGHSLAELAGQAISKAAGIPPGGMIIPKVQLRGDLTPQQEANIAQQNGWNEGPFGASIGPQGAQGTAANDNAINQGFVQGNAFSGGMPTGITPGQAINPQTPPQVAEAGTEQPVSQPGVATAPAVSPEGANAQMAQRQTGR